MLRDWWSHLHYGRTRRGHCPSAYSQGNTVADPRFPTLLHFPRPCRKDPDDSDFEEGDAAPDGVPQSLAPYFPDFPPAHFPCPLALEQAGFRDLLCYCYARSARLSKRKHECEDLWKIVNVDLVQKYAQNRSQIDVNERVPPGIPLLHLICKVGQCAHKPHSGRSRTIPPHQIPERNQLLQAVLVDKRLDVNALDLHGQSALAYSYSYTYVPSRRPARPKATLPRRTGANLPKSGDPADLPPDYFEGTIMKETDTTIPGSYKYNATVNWLNVKMLLQHPNFCCLDFPTGTQNSDGEPFLNVQLLEMVRRSCCLVNGTRLEMCAALSPERRVRLGNTINACGTEVQRAKSDRAYRREERPDDAQYSMTLLTRVLAKTRWSPVLTCEPAGLVELGALWRHPSLDRQRFLDEVAIILDETVEAGETETAGGVEGLKRIRWRDMAIGDRHLLQYFNCTPKAFDHLLQGIHVERLAPGKLKSISLPGRVRGVAHPTNKYKVIKPMNKFKPEQLKKPLSSVKSGCGPPNAPHHKPTPSAACPLNKEQ
mmetsp:Transcript_12097/g.29319  ORF Transcript_12097/g.29319 Transcript_12097/m.29319 type:complete len:541 (+) Transcript_12097:74-1696(+)|eukprot:g10809.t1